MVKKETHTSENAKLYELGFHILPTVAEDKVADAFSSVTGIISKNNGVVVKSGEPKAIKLAYTITKKIQTRNERFKSAYFSWIKFETSSEDIQNIKNQIDENSEILRYIIVKTVDDDEHSTIKLVGQEDTEEGLEEAKDSEMDSEEVVDTTQENSAESDSAENSEESTDNDFKKEEIRTSSEQVREPDSKKKLDEIDEVIDELVDEK